MADATIGRTGGGAAILDSSRLDPLRALETVTSDGGVTLRNGRTLTTPGPLTTAGAVHIGAGNAFTSTGLYRQDAGRPRSKRRPRRSRRRDRGSTSRAARCSARARSRARSVPRRHDQSRRRGRAHGRHRDPLGHGPGSLDASSGSRAASTESLRSKRRRAGYPQLRRAARSPGGHAAPRQGAGVLPRRRDHVQRERFDPDRRLREHRVGPELRRGGTSPRPTPTRSA